MILGYSEPGVWANGVTREGGGGGNFTSPSPAKGGGTRSRLVWFFCTIDVDNSGSRRDVDIHINIFTGTRNERYSHSSGAPGRLFKEHLIINS